jgi:hypothetical protein
MDKNILLKSSVYISLAVQLITGIVGAHGTTFKVPAENMMLKDINIMEFIVQCVEFVFYIYISMAVLKVSGITPRRYFDWNITTPIMLISTIMFYTYKHEQIKQQKLLDEGKITEEEKKENMSNIRLWSILKKEKSIIIIIVLFNFLMLVFGLLGEMGYMNLYLSNVLGFICFAVVFYFVYQYAKQCNDSECMRLYYFFLVVWSLYGVAQLLGVVKKNIMYNYLDVVAKNFYGLFIYYKLRQIKL